MAMCFKYTFLCSFLVFMCLSLAHVLSEPIRHRRQAATSYVIDVGVVVDDVMFARWIQWIRDNTNETNESIISLAEAKVREYVSLTFHQANVRMSTLTSLLGYTISLQVVNVTTNQAVLGVSAPVDAQLALETFKNWTMSHGLGSQFDHVMLMTSKSLTSSGYESSDLTYQGRAYVAAMCRPCGFSASVVEDRGGFLSSLTLAHELAHSLGAQHDGEFNSTAISCPSTDHYIMAAVGMPTSQELADRPWYFSRCSATDISKNIQVILDSALRNCLTTNGAPIPEFTATKSAVAGQLYPPTKQCQMVFGKDSKACPQASGSLENICTAMDCLQPGGANTCARYFAAEGTSCGSKKWCSKGRCMASEAAPEIGDCYLGDSLTTIVTKLGPQSCAAAVRSFPELCYNTNVTQMCCASCKAIERNVPACKYGDKADGCNAKDCSFYDADILAKCCGTCAKSPQNINNSHSTGSTVYAIFTITLLTCLISLLNTFD